MNAKFDALLSTMGLYAKFEQNRFIKSMISIKHIKENLDPAPDEIWPQQYMNIALSLIMSWQEKQNLQKHLYFKTRSDCNILMKKLSLY